MEMETVRCGRCNEVKSKKDFIYDKRRGKHQQPCRDCRNKQKRLRRKENYINSKFNETQINIDYRLEGLPKELKEVLMMNVLIKREIKSSKNIKVTQVNENIVLFCPVCGDLEIVSIPVDFELLIELGNLFKEKHEGCRKK